MYDDLTQYDIAKKHLPRDPDIMDYDWDNVVGAGELPDHLENIRVDAWAGSRPPVLKWATVAAELRRNYGAWVHVETPTKTVGARQKFAHQVNTGVFPAFDPEFFEAKTLDHQVFMRFTRP